MRAWVHLLDDKKWIHNKKNCTFLVTNFKRVGGTQKGRRSFWNPKPTLIRLIKVAKKNRGKIHPTTYIEAVAHCSMPARIGFKLPRHFWTGDAKPASYPLILFLDKNKGGTVAESSQKKTPDKEESRSPTSPRADHLRPRPPYRPAGHGVSRCRFRLPAPPQPHAHRHASPASWHASGWLHRLRSSAKQALALLSPIRLTRRTATASFIACPPPLLRRLLLFGRA
jgi:hypothetical protein